MVNIEYNEDVNITLVTLGCSSLCQTATSCVKAALREAISASDRWPSSPQSRSLTEKIKMKDKLLDVKSAAENVINSYFELFIYLKFSIKLQGYNTGIIKITMFHFHI